MGILDGRWIRFLALLAVIAVVALAAELAVITDAQIAKLAQQFGPVAKERLTGWREILISSKQDDPAGVRQNGLAAGV